MTPARVAHRQKPSNDATAEKIRIYNILGPAEAGCCPRLRPAGPASRYILRRYQLR